MANTDTFDNQVYITSIKNIKKTFNLLDITR